MKNLLLVLILVCLGLIGCDGRDRVNLSNTEVLKEHKLLDSFSEKVEYIPKLYNENTIDTILNNGFIVKIKNFTDMENIVLNQFKRDQILYKHFYRDNISEIRIRKDNQEILKLTINNTFIKKNHKQIDPFISGVINNGVWINQKETLNSNNVVLSTSFCEPENDICRDYKITIDAKGNYKVDLLEEVDLY